MCVCVCVCMCVCSYICLDIFTTTVRQLACYKHWPSPHDHPSRPLLDAIRLNRCRRKPCPSVNSQNVAPSSFDIIDVVIWKRV